MRTRSKVLLAGFAIAVLAGVAFSLAFDEARWRVRLVAAKATGRLPMLSWRELGRWLPPDSGVYLRPVADSKNPYASMVNERLSAADLRAGQELYEQHCSACHGADATGANGPALTGGLAAGNSDWSLFHTISEGIPGTPMMRRELPATEVWQIVAFVKRAIVGAALPADPAAVAMREALSGVDVPFSRLSASATTPDDWLMYSGGYDGQRFSRLETINRNSVGRLQVAWLFQLPTTHRVIEVTPLVVDDVMFLSLPPGDVWALDARTGAVLWTYRGAPSPRGLKLSVEPVNRGLAILGSTLYLARLDARLVALDAHTGREKWNVQVADYRDGFSMTASPLAIDGAIVVGVGGGELGVRGFVDAYSPETGKQLWRTFTVPGPGEPGHDTWGGGDAWRRGGAPTWLTGSYDPSLDLVYWPIGNPAPDFQGDVRPGDNLYSNCVLALERATGKIRWFFQFTPHDEHDWDSVQIPVLADAPFKGEPRRLMYWANRNGFYYVLDRVTGQFLHGRPFVKQTWAEGLDAKGRPIEIPSARPTPQGSLVSPAVQGATNWWSPAYDPRTNTFFVGALEGHSVFTKSLELTDADGLFFGSSGRAAPGVTLQAVRALDAETGALRWEHTFSGRARMGGLLATAGGVVFGSDRARFFALDSSTGSVLWQLETGDQINAAPVTYVSGGRQQVSIAAGRTIVTLGLDGPPRAPAATAK